MTNKKSSSTTTIAILAIIVIAAFVYFGQGTVINRIGLGLTLHYVDGTSRTVNSPVFSDARQLDTQAITLWDGTEAVSTIDVFMQIQNGLTASAFMYSCAYEIQIDSSVKRSGSVNAAVGIGSNIKTAALTTITNTEILGWTGTNNGTHQFAVNVPTGSILTAQTNDGQKMFTFDGQIVSMTLTVTDVVTTTPPIIEPPTGTSITLYTKSWSSATSQWISQGGVPVVVSWNGGTGTWITGVDGYVTVANMSAGTYTFSASFNSYSNSSTITVVANTPASVTLYFGTPTVPPTETTVFSDNFASFPGSNWATYLTTGSTATLSNGAMAASITGTLVNGTGYPQAEWARVYHTFASPLTQATYSAQITFNALPTGTGGYWNPFSVRVGTTNYDASALANIDIWNSGTSTVWRLYYRNAGSTTMQTTSSTVQANTAYTLSISLTVGSGNGAATFKVNGQSLLSLTGLNNVDLGGATRIYIGEYYASVSATGHSGAHITSIDNVLVQTP